MEDIIAIIAVFGTGMVAVVAFSPIGRAIADRMRGKNADALPSEEIDDLRAQLQGMQEQVSELAERQDFTERMLAQARERGALPPAKDVAS
jgi:hypothetical protein